ATFSEAMDAASITTTTFTLVVQATGTPITADLVYDPVSRTATLNPGSALLPATTYAATVVGGPSGVKDLAGSGLATDKAWSFTTEAIPNTTPPDTTIDSGPSGPTASTAATFTFSASEGGATFRCRLDSGTYATCTSSKSYTGLSQGLHTFAVYATDAAGNPDPSAATRSWTVDTTAPAAPAITAPANNSTNTSGTIVISGTAEPAATVEVFDGVAPQGTTTADVAGAWSKTLGTVSDGSHTYTAKATDAAGNSSPSSNSRTVTVDATAPETTIVSGPSGTTTSTSASFTFSSNEGGASFACSLDGAAFTTCTSPQSFSGLAEGAHVFSVRATDALGNTDATPASQGWTINLALFSDGFESGTFSAWTTLLTGGDGTAVVQGTTVKTGSFAAQLAASATTGSFAYARKTLVEPRTELRVKGDFQVELEGASGGNVPLIRLFDTAGTRIISLYRQNLDGNKIRITHNGVGVTTTGVLTLNTWAQLELHVSVPGTVEVLQNGTLIYQTTTASLGTNPMSIVQIGNETKAQAFKLVTDDVTVRP
nr:Ig-like domain-containing protein [Actinomycetota bacterium]